MNETLYDLEQKRNAVELDIQALYETLQKEIDKLLERIKTSYAKETEKLKTRICALETENLSLKRGAYLEDREKSGFIKFLKKDGNDAVN